MDTPWPTSNSVQNPEDIEEQDEEDEESVEDQEDAEYGEHPSGKEIGHQIAHLVKLGLPRDLFWHTDDYDSYPIATPEEILGYAKTIERYFKSRGIKIPEEKGGENMAEKHALVEEGIIELITRLLESRE